MRVVSTRRVANSTLVVSKGSAFNLTRVLSNMGGAT